MLMLDRFLLYYVVIVVIIAVAEIKQRLKRDSIGRSMLFHHAHNMNLKELDPEMPDDDEPTRTRPKWNRKTLKKSPSHRSMLFRLPFSHSPKEDNEPQKHHDEMTGPKSNPDTMTLANKRLTSTRAIQWKLLYAGFGVFIAGPVIAYLLAVVVYQIKQRFRLPLRNKQNNEEGECNIITCFHTMYKVYNTHQVPAVYSCE